MKGEYLLLIKVKLSNGISLLQIGLTGNKIIKLVFLTSDPLLPSLTFASVAGGATFSLEIDLDNGKHSSLLLNVLLQRIFL
jgi:hypothetical protein